MAHISWTPDPRYAGTANFFGKLAFESARPGEFMLEVDGSSDGPIRFDNKIVSEVEVTK